MNYKKLMLQRQQLQQQQQAIPENSGVIKPNTLKYIPP
jgi:hypothetical protein